MKDNPLSEKEQKVFGDVELIEYRNNNDDNNGNNNDDLFPYYDDLFPYYDDNDDDDDNEDSNDIVDKIYNRICNLNLADITDANYPYVYGKNHYAPVVLKFVEHIQYLDLFYKKKKK